MKQLANLIRAILLILFLLLPALSVRGQETDSIPEPKPLEISLLTCEPFGQIYALYGHTGLRIHDEATGMDVVANWGIFDMSKPFFAVNFTFGLTDYMMAIEPFEGFCNRYRHYGAGVREQVLDLTGEEMMAVMAAIDENFRPENRVYRYNFFYDNCTTRARDMVLRNLRGQISYEPLRSETPFREMIHQWNASHLWMRWGNDFLLGVGADKATDRVDQQFLPDSLRKDFDEAVVTRMGVKKPLVKETRWPVESKYTRGESSFAAKYILSPFGVGMVLLLLTVVVMAVETSRRRRLWQFDAILFVATGLMGLVLLAMVFSKHPTVSLNLQILVFNPLALFFLVPVVKKLRRGERSGLLSVLFVCYLAAIVGSLLQSYAEGVVLLLIALLLRAHNYNPLPIKK